MKKVVKNIAFVGNTSFSMYKFRLGVMRSFIEKGYKIFVIAPIDEYSPFFETEGIHFIPIEIDGQGTSLAKDMQYITTLNKIYKKTKIDFIFHYTIKPIIYGAIASRINKIPTISVTTGLGYTFESDKLLNKLVKQLYRISQKSVLEVWFLNNNDKSVFVKNNIVPENKTFILNGEGVDSTFYKPIEKEKDSRKFTFLLLSRLVEDKGIREYVEAAQILKNKGLEVECQLLGKIEKESDKTISIREVNEWHDNGLINYIGEAIDVRSYIANSDCVVLPSYYNEGVPRCLMEGMSMGKPIITTDNVGCVELIRDGINGFMCQKRDAVDLSLKMENLINLSENERNEMGVMGRKLILELFDEEAIIKVYHEKLDEFSIIK